MQEELENQTEATEAAMAADGAVEEANEVEVSAVETVADATAETSVEEEAGYKPHRKIRTGTVVSDKMEKSILVKVTRRVRHPLYKKYFFKSKKFMVHDENNECRTGDTVRIVETRPLSARKRWNLDKIVERAK
ncbi:MAG: 30S ribosomal protein S17 [Candidatus Kapaibacterium sp.]